MAMIMTMTTATNTTTEPTRNIGLATSRPTWEASEGNHDESGSTKRKCGLISSGSVVLPANYSILLQPSRRGPGCTTQHLGAERARITGLVLVQRSAKLLIVVVNSDGESVPPGLAPSRTPTTRSR